jgi:hypothetical protein
MLTLDIEERLKENPPKFLNLLTKIKAKTKKFSRRETN